MKEKVEKEKRLGILHNNFTVKLFYILSMHIYIYKQTHTHTVQEHTEQVLVPCIERKLPSPGVSDTSFWEQRNAPHRQSVQFGFRVQCAKVTSPPSLQPCFIVHIQKGRRDCSDIRCSLVVRTHRIFTGVQVCTLRLYLLYSNRFYLVENDSVYVFITTDLNTPCLLFTTAPKIKYLTT